MISTYNGKIELRNIENGINQYVPILFDSDWFNLVNSTFHIYINDFKIILLNDDEFNDQK